MGYAWNGRSTGYPVMNGQRIALWTLLPLLLLASCKEAGLLGDGMPPPYTVVTPEGRREGTLEQLLPELARKRVVYVGETHSRYGHHLLQLAVIRGLHERGVDLAIGMEFFQQPFQKWLDDYVAGRIDEAELLEKTQWFDRWRFDYRLYRPILRYAREHGIPLVALNVAREVTDEVSRKGIAGLSPAMRARLPAEIDRSDAAYRERLRKVYEQHAHRGEGRFERFLDVQYSWDESMAERVADYLRRHPGRHMVVLAGSGHLAWGSGIPRRVARRIGGDYAIVLPAGEEREPGMADYLVVAEEARLSPRPLMGIFIDTGEEGIRITGVSRDSGAARAGLRKGDRLVAIDGRPVASYAALRARLMDRKPGERVRVTVERDGRRLEKELELGAAEE